MNRFKCSSALVAALSVCAGLFFFAPSVAVAAEPAPAPSDSIEAGKQAPKTGAYSAEAIGHYNRGVELHQSGFLNKAIDEYRAAIDADQRMEEAYSNLGGIYAAQRSYAKALEAFEKALSLKPDRPTTLNGYGTVLYAKGRIEEAKNKWRQAIATDSKFASAYYNMGNALEGEKKPSEALDLYVKAIEVNPSMADAYYRIGCLLSKDHHSAQAKVMLAKALDLSPGAEFTRDARKQLQSITSELSFDSSNQQPDVEMNIMPPSNPAVPAAVVPTRELPTTVSTVNSMSSSASNAPTGPKGASDGTQIAGNTPEPPADKERSARGGLFKHKQKAKKLDMFIQQGASSSNPAEQDLKAMPAGSQ